MCRLAPVEVSHYESCRYQFFRPRAASGRSTETFYSCTAPINSFSDRHCFNQRCRSQIRKCWGCRPRRSLNTRLNCPPNTCTASPERLIVQGCLFVRCHRLNLPYCRLGRFDIRFWAEKRELIYSALRACMGSTEAARRAGTRQAMTAAKSKSSATDAKTERSSFPIP